MKVDDAYVDLSIIIVNWNTRELLAECLESVAGSGLEVEGRTDEPVTSGQLRWHNLLPSIAEVIVVDNASTDGSAAMVRERFPWVRLVENRENLGFARANNAAIQEANGDVLLLLNPDTVILGDALQRLHGCFNNLSSLAAVAPQLEYPDGSPQGSWGDFPDLRRELPWLRGRRNLTKAVTAGASRLLEVDWAKGACLMIRRTAWEQVGELDEDYWLYTEEADWCYRARQKGWTIAVVPDARVIHVEQAASRQNATRSLIQYHRSRALFLNKHGSLLAARTLWGICALKAGLYVAAPEHSPLGRGRNELGVADVRRAYRGLLRESLRQIVTPGTRSQTTPDRLEDPH